jgi:hypothetical protein
VFAAQGDQSILLNGCEDGGDALEATVVAPAEVTSTDPCGTINDKYTIPTTTGVDYQIDGKIIAAGTYNGTSNVTVKAVAKTGFKLKAGSKTTFSITFTNVSCGGGGIGGDGGGRVLGATTVVANQTPAVLALFTPQVLGASTTGPNNKQLVNTGGTMLVNLFAGLFIIGMVVALTATQKRQYS